LRTCGTVEDDADLDIIHHKTFNLVCDSAQNLKAPNQTHFVDRCLSRAEILKLGEHQFSELSCDGLVLKTEPCLVSQGNGIHQSKKKEQSETTQ
jgi:hypothetical protein